MFAFYTSRCSTIARRRQVDLNRRSDLTSSSFGVVVVALSWSCTRPPRGRTSPVVGLKNSRPLVRAVYGRGLQSVECPRKMKKPPEVALGGLARSIY